MKKDNYKKMIAKSRTYRKKFSFDHKNDHFENDIMVTFDGETVAPIFGERQKETRYL